MDYRQQSIVYIDFNGLKHFYSEYLRKSINELKIIKANLPEIVTYVDNLLFSYSTIGVNYDDFSNHNDEGSKILKQRIISINHPLNIHHSIDAYEAKNSIEDFDILPNYVLTNWDSHKCAELESFYGIKFIPRDLENWNIGNCKIEVKQIQAKNTDVVVQTIQKLRNVNRIQSMLLIDKYIYENIFINNNDVLLEFVNNWELFNDKEAIVCGSSNDLNVLIENYRRQHDIYFYNQYIKFPLEIDFNRIHDRYLFSNCFYISSGLGFQKSYPKSTEWIIYPIGLGRIYFDKIKEISQTLFKTTPYNLLLKYVKDVN